MDSYYYALGDNDKVINFVQAIFFGNKKIKQLGT